MLYVHKFSSYIELEIIVAIKVIPTLIPPLGQVN
jgi:hypothetical protein